MVKRSERRATVCDDRGRDVETLSPSNLVGLSKDSPQVQLISRLVCNDYTITGPRALAGAVILVVALLVIMAVLERFALPEWVETVAALGIFLSAMALANYLFWTGSGKQVAATAVRRGLCGSCGYTLESLEKAEDGCIVCPECGAAWRAERLTRPHWTNPAFVEGEGKSMPLMVSLGYRLTEDDRGAFANVLDVRLRGVCDSAAVTREEHESIRRDLRTRGRGSRMAITMLLVVPAGFLLLGSITSGDPVFAAIGIVLALITALGVWVVQRSLGHIPRRAFCEVLKAHGIMPCCGVRLEGEPDESGCVTCENCGAGWRVASEDEAHKHDLP